MSDAPRGSHSEQREGGEQIEPSEGSPAPDFKLSLVDPSGPPSGAPTPWTRACSAAWADIDFFQSERRPTWCGGLCFVALIIIIVALLLIEYYRNTGTSTAYSLENTYWKEYQVVLRCDKDTLSGIYEGGNCNYSIVYNQTVLIPRGDGTPAQQIQENPCHQYNIDSALNVGYNQLITLCGTYGPQDGLYVYSIPGKTRTMLVEYDQAYDIPAGVGANFQVTATRERQTFVNGSTYTVWTYTPVAYDYFGTGIASKTLLRLAPTFSLSEESHNPNPSRNLGLVGGGIFLIWFLIRLLVDAHARFTRPYRGQLVPRHQVVTQSQT